MIRIQNRTNIRNVVLKVEDEWLASEKLSFDNNIGMKLKEPTINELLFVIPKQQNILNVTN
jgi:hypothetical protein